MIVNIRGTSGSGKTTAARALFSLAGRVALYDAPRGASPLAGRRPSAYQLGLQPAYLVGSYETECGGCDTIKTQELVCERVATYAALGHVVFEGLLVSTLYERYARLARSVAPTHPFVWAFLDTPLDECLRHVAERRCARGDLRPLDPTNTTAKWHLMRRLYAKCQAAGLDARWVPWETAGEEIWSWLK